MNETQIKTGRVKRRRTRTRAALLDAAERAFMRDGYHAVRMETLADEADVSVGSIYNLFSNKAGLYLAVAERATELFTEYLERAYAVSESPLEQVMACGDAYLRFHLEHPGAFRFIAFNGVESFPPVEDDATQQALTARTVAALDQFRDRIAAAVDAGEASPHIDPTITARVLFGAWNGMIGLGLRRDELALDNAAIAQSIEQARHIVLDGLTNPNYRDKAGHSRAHLLSIPTHESSTEAPDETRTPT
jgi:TetR/AcrR family transcriptional regulator